MSAGERDATREDRIPVITGAGAVSAFGDGLGALLGALAEGRSGVGPIASFDAATFPVRVAGEVPVPRVSAAWLAPRLAVAGGPADGPGHDPGPGEALAASLEAQGALRDRKLAWGLAAAAEAWQRAGCTGADRGASLVIALGLEQAFLEDFGPIFTGHRSPLPGHAAPSIAWDAEPAAALPHVRFRSPVDLTARAIRRLLGLRGPAIVNASACAAGALAVAHAASLVARGAAELVLCGAADSMVNPLGLGGMCRLGAPSPRNEPDACRPFDRRRDGLVIGEGAAMFVVEPLARALARGARPLARILGWGSTQDAYRATAPRPDGAAARGAMQRAIAGSGLPADAIGYVNAHGTGTPLNDPAECKAIRDALGPHAERVAVSSIKGAVGHLMAASGALELAASLLPFERDLLPGTAHHGERDPACDLDIIGPVPRRARVAAVLSNSFGFGGQNASIVLGRPAP
jgi:3-oxoacyl-[acyl-carrier-protein] synthase II